MGKSSPTKLQLKHIPDLVVIQTVYCIQSQWAVWVGSAEEMNSRNIFDALNRVVPARSLHYRQKRTASLYEVAEALKPIPEKLVWAKLRKLERQGKLISYGPASIRFRVEMDDE